MYARTHANSHSCTHPIIANVLVHWCCVEHERALRESSNRSTRLKLSRTSMSRQMTVKLGRVITQVSIQEEYWGLMSDGSFAPTSIISRQNAHIGGVFAWHNTRHKRTCRSHQSDLLVSTDQARLSLLHLPLRNDPRLTRQRKLPVPPRSSSSCGPFRLCSVRLTKSRHRVGMGAS